jgi:hypothetical protein
MAWHACCAATGECDSSVCSKWGWSCCHVVALSVGPLGGLPKTSQQQPCVVRKDVTRMRHCARKCANAPNAQYIKRHRVFCSMTLQPMMMTVDSRLRRLISVWRPRAVSGNVCCTIKSATVAPPLFIVRPDRTLHPQNAASSFGILKLIARQIQLESATKIQRSVCRLPHVEFGL